jgi:hypothetical protein
MTGSFKKGFITGASITAGVVVALFLFGYIEKAV